jgi:hypothetical protein
MAYAGLERIVRTLLQAELFYGVNRESIGRFVVVCGLPPYGEPLVSPRRSPLRLAGTAAIDQRGAVRAFLDGRSVQDWSEAVFLAQGLRNATSHGSLSAYRCERTGLRPVFNRLTLEVGEIAAAAIARLAGG